MRGPGRAWDVVGAAQTFVRRGRQGAWERLPTLAQGRAGGIELGMAFPD